MKKITGCIIMMTGILLSGCQGKTESTPKAENTTSVSIAATETAIISTETSTELIVIDTATAEMPTELPSVDIRRTDSKTKINVEKFTNMVSPGGEAYAELTAFPHTEYLATVSDEKHNTVDVQKIISDENGNLLWQWNVPFDFFGVYTVKIQGDSKECSFDISVAVS